MSFILDALRKLEEKQSRDTTRELLGSGGGLPQAGRRKRKGILVSAGLLLVLAALVPAWFLLRGGSNPEEAIPPVESTIEVSPPALPIPGGRREEAVPAEPVEPSPASPETGEPGGSTLVERKVGGDAASLPNVAGAFVSTPGDALPVDETEPFFPADEEPPEETAGAEPTAGSGVEAPVPSDRLLSFEELPDDVRAALKELRISGHIYSSDPLLRRLNVNDGMWREGDTLSGGIIIKEVTEDGAVFLYGGYRFFMRVYP